MIQCLRYVLGEKRRLRRMSRTFLRTVYKERNYWTGPERRQIISMGGIRKKWI